MTTVARKIEQRPENPHEPEIGSPGGACSLLIAKLLNRFIMRRGKSYMKNITATDRARTQQRKNFPIFARNGGKGGERRFWIATRDTFAVFIASRRLRYVKRLWSIFPRCAFTRIKFNSTYAPIVLSNKLKPTIPRRVSILSRHVNFRSSRHENLRFAEPPSCFAIRSSQVPSSRDLGDAPGIPRGSGIKILKSDLPRLPFDV